MYSYYTKKIGEQMNPGVARSDLPDLRDFLDSLPTKPCPSKLPEDYCKMCKRLNGEVYNYCTKQIKPPTPEKGVIEEQIMPETEEKQGEPTIPTHKRTPILEKPRYEEGETPIEFAPSQKSIEEAKKSLPKFIPVKKKPRTFRALEEPGPEEFASFDIEGPSIFRSPASLGMSEEDMMFSLVSDEGSIEVEPLEISGENTMVSETIYEDSDGIVEAVEILEGETQDIEMEPPVFQFIDEGEADFGETEIEDISTTDITQDEGITPDGYSFGDSIDEAERLISELAEEISGITDKMESGHEAEGKPPIRTGSKKAVIRIKVKRKGKKRTVEPKKQVKMAVKPKKKVKMVVKKKRKPVVTEPKEVEEEEIIQEPIGEEEPIEEPKPIFSIQPSEDIKTEPETKEEELKSLFGLEPDEEIEPDAEIEEENMEEELQPLFGLEHGEEATIEPEIEEDSELKPMDEMEPSAGFETEAELGEEKVQEEEELPPMIEPGTSKEIETETEDMTPSAEDMLFKIKDETEKFEDEGAKATKKKLKKVKVKKKRKMKMKKLKVKKHKEEGGEEAE